MFPLTNNAKTTRTIRRIMVPHFEFCSVNCVETAYHFPVINSWMKSPRHPGDQRQQAGEVSRPRVGAWMRQVDSNPVGATHQQARVVAVKVQQPAGKKAALGHRPSWKLLYHFH